MINQILIVVLGMSIVVVWLWKLRRFVKKSSTLPPLLSGYLPIIGHAWRFVGDRTHLFNIIKSISEETLERGGVLTVKFGTRAVIVISDPDDCAKVSNECLEKDHYYRFYKPLIGNGLTTADVPLWKEHRKNLNPIFRQAVLNDFLAVFNYHGRRLVKHFEPNDGKGQFDHEPYIRLNSLESICMTAFNEESTDLCGIQKQYSKEVTKALEVIMERIKKIWLHSDLIYNLSNLKKRQDICLKNIRKFINSIIQRRYNRMKESQNHNELGNFKPFLGSLLEHSKETGCYSEEYVFYETNTLISGGFDTSSCAITLVLALLGSHPEVQNKIYIELEQVFNYSNRDLEKDDLPKLFYLEAVIKETLRLYPVGPIVGRHAVKDVQLKNCTIKAGCGVGLLFWAMHRHPMWGPDAEVFRPERWLDGSLPANPNAFGAFSLGRRSCIGKTYAMMFMKTILAHVILNYRITSDISKLKLEVTTLLKPSSGHHISIDRRQPNH